MCDQTQTTCDVWRTKEFWETTFPLPAAGVFPFIITHRREWLDGVAIFQSFFFLLQKTCLFSNDVYERP